MEGKVKWFNREKRYGFIEGDDGQEYFVHQTNLKEGTNLNENDKVSFEPGENEKGKQAQNVTLIEEGSSEEVADEEDEIQE
jgi:CspA family cold shock protein|tara:strand:- start:14260 stop:14502 length:243 start_codon:yes stop_codon:yes gene_type:complete